VDGAEYGGAVTIAIIRDGGCAGRPGPAGGGGQLKEQGASLVIADRFRGGPAGEVVRGAVFEGKEQQRLRAARVAGDPR